MAGVTPIDAATEAESIHLVEQQERDAAVGALSRAFENDPLFRWMLPDDSRRLGRIERLFGLFGRRFWFDFGLAFTTAHHAGAAIWVPPDRWHLGFIQQVRLLPGMVVGARGGFPRMMRVLNLMEANHPHEPAYYLPVIGVDPPWQGRGLGGALLRPMLERCDREGLGAYLEASTPRNRALYERHGFEVTGELSVADSPPLWPMWRAPRRS